MFDDSPVLNLVALLVIGWQLLSMSVLWLLFIWTVMIVPLFNAIMGWS